MTATPHAAHDDGELCEAGSELYARALHEGRLPRHDTDGAPCLIDLGLLRVDTEHDGWLLPVPPSVVLPRLLHTIEQQLLQERRHEVQLADAFAPLLDVVPKAVRTEGPPAIAVLEGLTEIQAVIGRAMARTRQEVLVIQPGGHRPAEALAKSLADAQGMLARGARMRTLYQHTTRYSFSALAYYEQLDGDIEVRTLEEVTERLFILDRSVAYIPVTKERNVALEIRHPALIDFLIAAFKRQWNMAIPLFPQAAPQPAPKGISTRQRAVAGLLVEGLTDAEIADRLGMNVRTARVHIAKLAATLGSESRAQLGFLIGESKILEQRNN